MLSASPHPDTNFFTIGTKVFPVAARHFLQQHLSVTVTEAHVTALLLETTEARLMQVLQTCQSSWQILTPYLSLSKTAPNLYAGLRCAYQIARHSVEPPPTAADKLLVTKAVSAALTE